jgi:hypothetical protein
MSVACSGRVRTAAGCTSDGALKYSRLDNEIDITSNLGDKVKARYKNHAVSADVQVGKHIDLGRGWFVEPQAGTANGVHQWRALHGQQWPGRRAASDRRKTGQPFAGFTGGDGGGVMVAVAEKHSFYAEGGYTKSSLGR